MMYCSKCGAQIVEGAAFCGRCGASLQECPPVQETEACEMTETMAQPEPAAVPEVPAEQPREQAQTDAFRAETQNANPYRIPIRNYDPSKDYTPIGMWGYFGYQILFAIPILGLILIFVFSFGGTRNINLRNYARSTFCWLIIVVVVLLAVLLVGAIAAAASAAL